MTDRTRNWCFTWNNYTIDDINTLFAAFGGAKSVKYLVIGKEVGDSGTPHLQGYIDFINARTLNGLKKLVSTKIHWEPRRGTWDQAVDYCKKDGDWTEIGTPNQQGNRTDLKSITQAILEGKSNREISLEYLDKSLRIMNHINTVRALHFEQKRNWEMDVRIYWGAPGTGKTKAVFDEFHVDDIYTKMVGKWWDGYKGEKVVLIDDFDPDGCFGITFDFYLKLLDRYPMRIEWKGGSGEFYSRVIIFTSNYDPEDWFNGKSNKAAFFRRVNHIRNFGNNTDTEVGGVILNPPCSENSGTPETSVEILTRQLIIKPEDRQLIDKFYGSMKQ